MLKIACGSCAAVLCSVSPAYAYVDPGAGSYVFQLLIAGLLGALFMMKTFWGSIRSFFRKRFLHKP